MALVGIGAAAARVHAGDHLAGDADIGFADFTGDHVDYLRPGQQQVKRYFAPGGHDGAAAVFSIAGHNNSGTRIMGVL